MCPLLWVCKSTRQLAKALGGMGHRISHQTVATLLHEMGYSLQANRKTLEGSSHPDRDAQFEFINRRILEFQRHGRPAISVDTKKKENLGNYKNGGSEWGPEGEPVRVKAKDFPDKALGKIIPYGVYDITHNLGHVGVGVSHDTAAFAAHTILRWWQTQGQARHPGAAELLITADGGGSNGYRSRLWQLSLQGLADATGLRVWVCHLPPGTSKWNKIEHRLFCHITRNWRARPLTSREVAVRCIAATTTEAGLIVHAELDEATYPAGVKVPDELLATVRVQRHPFQPEWNYSITPRQWFVQVLV